MLRVSAPQVGTNMQVTGSLGSRSDRSLTAGASVLQTLHPASSATGACRVRPAVPSVISSDAKPIITPLPLCAAVAVIGHCVAR